MDIVINLEITTYIPNWINIGIDTETNCIDLGNLIQYPAAAVLALVALVVLVVVVLTR